LVVVAEDVSLGARPREATSAPASEEAPVKSAPSQSSRTRGRKKVSAAKADAPFKEGNDLDPVW
jgi:hypothetical protein